MQPLSVVVFAFAGVLMMLMGMMSMVMRSCIQRAATVEGRGGIASLAN